MRSSFLYGPFSLLFAVLVLGTLSPEPARASNDPARRPVQHWQDWYVASFAGQWIGGQGSTSLSGLTDYNNLQNTYLYTVNVGKQIRHPYDSLYIDVEGQVGRHAGIQGHQEVVGVLVARWEYFPWDHELDTSFSAGEGLSWASEVPVHETNAGDNSARLLNYVLFDIAVSPWREKRWEGFFRVHHRSGIFGTFSDVYGASNFVGFGVRYRY